jgi:hypothetical protein
VTIKGTELTIKYKESIKALKYRYSTNPSKWQKSFALETFSLEQIVSEISIFLDDLSYDYLEIEVAYEGSSKNYIISSRGLE